MKLSRCPVCHSNIHLDQLVSDESGRQLLGLISKLGYRMGPALVSYLALFRPAKQDLSNSKALTLASEVLALTSNQAVLSEALKDTVTSIHASRINGQQKQLINHNYLKKVLSAKVALATVAPDGSTVEIKNLRTETTEETRDAFNARMQQLGGKLITVVKNDSNKNR